MEDLKDTAKLAGKQLPVKFEDAFQHAHKTVTDFRVLADLPETSSIRQQYNRCIKHAGEVKQ